MSKPTGPTEAAGSPGAIVVHPGEGGDELLLVPDDTRFTVAFSLERTPLSREAQAVLREHSAPVAQLPRYGIRVYDGPTRSSRDTAVAVLNREPAVDTAAPVMHRHTRDGDEVYVTRGVLAQFWPDVTRERLDALLVELGAEVVRPLGYAENGFELLSAPTPDGLGAVHLAERLRDSGLTVFAHPDLVSKRHRRSTVLDSPAVRGTRSGDLTAVQWHLTQARVNDAWSLGTGSADVRIAILDDGVDVTHPEFDGRVVDQHDFNDGTDDGTPKSDDDKHGTACTGVAAAAGVRASGAAPGCSILAVRFPPALGDSDEAEMFRWAADHGADVISCSWGPADGTGQSDPLPGSTQAAIRYCLTTGRGGKGIPILWAAGNGNESVDLDGYAANPDVIAVAASTDRSTRSWYSDMGAALWVSAPSSGDRDAGEKSITTTDRQGAAGYNDGAEGIDANYTSTFGGTSSATPLVAGIVALMISANPDLTVDGVREALRDTARKIGSGYDGSGHSTEFGYGLVDAYEAVRHAQAAAGQVEPAPGRPSVIGPASADRAGDPPRFEVDPGGGQAIYYAVEVATSADLLDGGDHALDQRFYATWQDEAFQSSSPYELPSGVWQRLAPADRIYYRAWFSTSPSAWENVVVTTADESWAQAPSIAVTGTERSAPTAPGDRAGSSIPSRSTPAAPPPSASRPAARPTIAAPQSSTRGGPAPLFDLSPAPGSSSVYYAVEVAANPALLDGAEHSLEEGFYASWKETPFLSSSPFQLPDDAWRSLSTADTLSYRAMFSSSDREWADLEVTTPDAEARSAPTFAVVDPTGPEDRSRSIHPAVTGPTSLPRAGEPPAFDVRLPDSAVSWVVEACTDVRLFAAGEDLMRIVGSWWSSTPLPARLTSVTMDVDGWQALRHADRLFYRVSTSPAPPASPWYAQDSSTAAGVADSAPWVEVRGADRTRSVADGPTRVSDPDELRWRRRTR